MNIVEATAPNPVDLAASAVGNQAKLATLLEITAQAISKWRTGGIPAERVLDVERVTGVHRHYLNPSIYPDPPAAERRRARV